VGWGESPQHYLGEPLTGQEGRALFDMLRGRDATAIAAFYADWKIEDELLSSALEMAMWDVLGKVCRQPVYQLLGGLYRRNIALAACIGIRPPEEVKPIARLYAEQGYTTIKTKGGRDAEEDLAMARAIREAVGDQVKLRIDPNTGYSPEVCEQLAKDLEPYNLEYFEQPMPENCDADSARIRKLTSTPLALNESVTTLASVREILALDAAAYLLPDTYQCGGMWAVKLVGEVAASAGVPCILHCAHDLGLKTAAMLHLAASTPNFPLANDTSYYGMEGDILREPLKIERGHIAVPDAPGLGVEVDMAQVRKYLVGASE
jgi:L-alanine-DL-glutamate epimerase-like enolase superfamily enzyme